MAVARITSGMTAVALIAAVFLLYGYVYETSYFITLGLSASSTLNIRHFIYSGFMQIIPPVAFLVGLSLLLKFFSRHVERDDADAFVKAAKEIGFAQSLSMARLVFLFCVGVWLFAIFEHHFFERPHAFAAVPWLQFFVLQAFAFAMYTCPPQSRATLAFSFGLAIALCMSSWAVGLARFAQSPESAGTAYVRDDGVVRISRIGRSFTAEPKPLKLPLPFLEMLAAAVSGESK